MGSRDMSSTSTRKYEKDGNSWLEGNSVYIQQHTIRDILNSLNLDGFLAAAIPER
jgi:hypothetical protein